MEIAYLVKGLSNLHSFIKKDTNLQNIEQTLRRVLIARLNSDHALMSSFEPYSISKLLRYLFKFNNETDQ